MRAASAKYFHKSNKNLKQIYMLILSLLSLSVSHSVVSNSLGSLWTVACQAPLSIGFPRQEYWSGLPFSSPGDIPDPGIEPGSPALQADSLPSQPSREKGGKKKKKGGTVCHKRKGTKEQLRSVECRVGKISWFPFLRREK